MLQIGSRLKRLLASATVVACCLSASGPLAAQQQPTQQTTFEVPGQPQSKAVDKVYVVGYTLAALMVGLGLLVVSRSSRRKERPELPQEELADRLRHMHSRKPAADE